MSNDTVMKKEGEGNLHIEKIRYHIVETNGAINCANSVVTIGCMRINVD